MVFSPSVVRSAAVPATPMTSPVSFPVPFFAPTVASAAFFPAPVYAPTMASAAFHHPAPAAVHTPAVKQEQVFAPVHTPTSTSIATVQKEHVFVPGIKPTVLSNRRLMGGRANADDTTDDELPVPILPPEEIYDKQTAADNLAAATYRLRTARRLKARLQYTTTRKSQHRLEIEQEILLVDEMIAEARMLVTELTPVDQYNTDAFNAEMAGNVSLQNLDLLLTHPTVRSAIKAYENQENAIGQKNHRSAFVLNSAR